MPTARDTRGTQKGTAQIRGRVVAAETGTPLRRAQVLLSSPETQFRRAATTDSEGRFEFADLPAGRFSMSANKSGYVGLQYGQRRPFEAGTPVSVAESEHVERIDFALIRGGVIVVRVIDDFGEPLAGAQIQVQRYQYGPDGERRLTQAPIGTPFMTMTDDRGELRAFGLTPGEYVISANVRNIGVRAPSDEAREGFSPTFYPGTVSAAEAQAISIGAGEERTIQFAMTAARLARISGTVVNSEGLPAVGAQLMVMTRQGNGGSSYGGGTVAADGTFTISGVAPGEHAINVRPPFRPGRGGSGGEFASMPVSVSGSDITGLRIVTGKGATISGRVVYEGTAKRDGLPASPRVMATPVDPSGQFAFGNDPRTNGVVEENGNFRLTAGATGRVFLNMVTPQSCGVKSITFEGEDIIDQPLDLSGRQSVTGVVIRLTDKLTQVSGRVSDGRGQLVRDYVVVIQPSEAKEPIVASRATRVARPDSSGRFESRGLRPGHYVATAIEILEQGRQFAPEFREQLRRGGREFSLSEGQTVALELTLTSGL
jgi:protocatechuate 3,4-dioxygenase beta subunit